MERVYNSKRGISNLIAYIILVTLAISMSTLAYNWLLHLIPEEHETCPEELSLRIDDISCDATGHYLNFTVKNNGAFRVDRIAVYVNDHERSDIGVYLLNDTFTYWPDYSLAPQEKQEYTISYRSYVETTGPGSFQSDLKLLEIRPFRKTEEGNFTTCHTVQTRLQCSTAAATP